MRKTVVYELLSLDGVADVPETFFPDWNDVLNANLARVIGRQDAVILGRRSYDDWSRFWPQDDTQPFADFINGVTKYVATSTPINVDVNQHVNIARQHVPDHAWADAKPIGGDLAEFVRDLKRQPGGDIGVHASISVARSLLAAGVVDELEVVISPRIVGHGRRLLDGLPPLHLETIHNDTAPGGYLMVGYRLQTRDRETQDRQTQDRQTQG
jgi:dihydrofolate reductase